MRLPAFSLQLLWLRPIAPMCTIRLHFGLLHGSFSRPCANSRTGIQQVMSNTAMGCYRWVGRSCQEQQDMWPS